MVTRADIRLAARSLGLSGRPLCVHSSLRSFGWVEGGAQTVVEGLLTEGCTVLVPTFSPEEFAAPPPLDDHPSRNGMFSSRRPDTPLRPYSPDLDDIDLAEMGAIPAAVVSMTGRLRGNHPLCSFSAVGPLAGPLIGAQTPAEVFAPLRVLRELDGLVVMIGVGLSTMTLIHLAEQEAGRRMFIRWALAPDGSVIRAECGGCSRGFGALEPVLDTFRRLRRVGSSSWAVYPAADVLRVAAAAIRANPEITRCSVPDCERCEDAIAGGPIVA